MPFFSSRHVCMCSEKSRYSYPGLQAGKLDIEWAQQTAKQTIAHFPIYFFGQYKGSSANSGPNQQPSSKQRKRSWKKKSVSTVFTTTMKPIKLNWIPRWMNLHRMYLPKWKDSADCDEGEPLLYIWWNVGKWYISLGIQLQEKLSGWGRLGHLLCERSWSQDAKEVVVLWATDRMEAQIQIQTMNSRRLLTAGNG